MYSDKEPSITVIIPVYKVEEYLAACLDSVLAQTWKNIEVICVDDASPDGCGKMRFEDEDFAVPDDWEWLLRHWYGDYMQLPPEEKRVAKYIKDVIEN